MMSAFRIPATFSKFYCFNSEEKKKRTEHSYMMEWEHEEDAIRG